MYSFPHAGGSAANFKAFSREFPEKVAIVRPVELPGRGLRAGEPFSKDLESCVDSTLQQLPFEIGARFLLHGHCMGALLAFEAVKALERSGRPLPDALIVSGRNAPGYQTDWGLRVANLPDREFFDELRAVGGVPPGLSFAMAAQFLTIIREDQRIVHGYRPNDSSISTPILVLAGEDDGMTRPDFLEHWAKFSATKVEVKMMKGGHYFIYNQAPAFAEALLAFEK
ncbi:thioesterase II family protein [Nguyenibacter vanlangensis]|nr:alpha/beta fold hydrolase [Nguyenibacter vanlangensis]